MDSKSNDNQEYEINIQSPDIAYRMNHPEAQEEHDRLMNRLFPAPKEKVNHPEHYKEGGLEAIDVINAFEHLRNSFSLGNVAKYILRAGKKDNSTFLEDLKKARWYLDEEISRLEGIPQGKLESR